MVKETNADALRGNLDLMVLSTLIGGPKYGYLIQQRLSDASRGLIAIQAGTLYPILHGMERQGYLRSRGTSHKGRNRRVYRSTPAGRKALITARKRVKELFGETFEHG